MKYSAVIVLVVLIACVEISTAQSHNISWGNLNATSQLVSQEIVIKKYKFLQIVTQDYKFPDAGRFTNKTITGIRVTDQYTDGDGGYATLYAGGPEYRNVTIHLKSQRNHGFNFIIEIYGR